MARELGNKLGKWNKERAAAGKPSATWDAGGELEIQIATCMYLRNFTHIHHIFVHVQMYRDYIILMFMSFLYLNTRKYIYIYIYLNYIHTYLYLDGRCIKENEVSRKLGLCCKLGPVRSYNVSTGGGPGIMEAANRGAHEAGDTTLGFGASRPEHFGCNKCFSFCIHNFSILLMEEIPNNHFWDVQNPVKSGIFTISTG